MEVRVYNNTIQLYNLETGKIFSELRIPSDKDITTVAISGDQQTIVAVDEDNIIHFFTTRERQRQFKEMFK